MLAWAVVICIFQDNIQPSSTSCTTKEIQFNFKPQVGQKNLNERADGCGNNVISASQASSLIQRDKHIDD